MFFDIVGKSVPISQIRLQGKWLQECDFEPESHVQIQCECDKLVITKESWSGGLYNGESAGKKYKAS